jgi:hypothetical protein
LIIRSNGRERSTGLMAKKTKKLTTHINGIFHDLSSADEK